MNDKQKAVIQTVINTLNSIEVSGKQNLDYLLGCIIVLEQLDNAEVDDG